MQWRDTQDGCLKNPGYTMVPNFCCITVSLAVCATFSNIISFGFCATPKAAKLLLVPVQLRKVSSNFCAPWSSMQKGKGTQSCRAEFLSACNKLFRGYWQLATSIRAEGLWSVTILYWCWAYCSRKLQRRKRKTMETLLQRIRPWPI